MIVAGPRAEPDRFVVIGPKDHKFYVLGNDSPGALAVDKTTLGIVVPPVHAKEYRSHEGHLHYKPAKGYTGADELMYEICDVQGNCTSALVIVNVG